MITRCISELLINHDCVIIPGFGGLIAQSVGASFNSEKKAILPPSRRLLFNNQLVINDGLLVNCISRYENISYAEASLQVMKWTEEIRNAVNSGDRYIMEGIGSFYLNHEKKLQFTPDSQRNFLLSSYGLKPVSVHAVTKTKPIEVGRKESHSELHKVVEYVSIAAAIALLIASVLMFPKFEKELASLAGFGIKQLDTPSKEAGIEPQVHAAETHQAEISEHPNPKPNPENIVETSELPAPKTDLDSLPSAVAEQEKITSEPAVLYGNFHVIAGCFRMEENAVKLVEDLKTQGLQADIIGKSKSGLTMVSAARVSSASEAGVMLVNLKPLLPDGGWVYHQHTLE